MVRRRQSGQARDIARAVQLAQEIQRDDLARKTSRWDVADSLKTKEDIAAYLDAALDDGDPDLLKAALGDIARAKGMTEIAEAAGLGRTISTRRYRRTATQSSRPSPDS